MTPAPGVEYALVAGSLPRADEFQAGLNQAARDGWRVSSFHVDGAQMVALMRREVVVDVQRAGDCSIQSPCASCAVTVDARD